MLIMQTSSTAAATDLTCPGNEVCLLRQPHRIYAPGTQILLELVHGHSFKGVLGLATCSHLSCSSPQQPTQLPCQSVHARCCQHSP